MGTRTAHLGLTFLEVIMSLAMAGTLAALITGAIGFMERAHRDGLRRLDAHEVAHRIIIQQIDDDRLWKQEPNRVELNGTVYEFEMRLEVLVAEDEPETGRARRQRREIDDTSFSVRLMSKLHLVSVKVWAVNPPQISPEPLATLTRVYNFIDRDSESIYGVILRMQEDDLQRQINQAREQRERLRQGDGQASPPAGRQGGGASR